MCAKWLQLCPTLCDPIDRSPPDSSVHWIFQATTVKWNTEEYLPYPPPGALPHPGIKPGSPAFQADSLPSEPPGSPSREEGTGLFLVHLNHEEVVLWHPIYTKEWKWKFGSVMSDSLRHHGRYSLWNSPDKDTGVCSLSLLQWIFLTQELNWGLPPCRCILYQLSYQWESPVKIPAEDEWIRKLWYIYTMEYYSDIKKNSLESVLMRWMKLESII